MYARVYAPDSTQFEFNLGPLARLGSDARDNDIYVASSEGPPVVVQEQGGSLHVRNIGSVPLPLIHAGAQQAMLVPQTGSGAVRIPQGRSVKLYESEFVELVPGQMSPKYKANPDTLRAATKFSPCAIDKVALAGNEALILVAANPYLGPDYAFRLAQIRWIPFWRMLYRNPSIGPALRRYLDGPFASVRIVPAPRGSWVVLSSGGHGRQTFAPPRRDSFATRTAHAHRRCADIDQSVGASLGHVSRVRGSPFSHPGRRPISRLLASCVSREWICLGVEQGAQHAARKPRIARRTTGIFHLSTGRKQPVRDHGPTRSSRAHDRVRWDDGNMG